MHYYEICIYQRIRNAILNKGHSIHRTPKIREICKIRDSDDMNVTLLQQEHSKNVTLCAKLVFFYNGEMKKKVYKPLRPLGFNQIAVTYQMLHWCNILT